MVSKNYFKAKALLEKFYAGKCAPEELELLESWYKSLDDGSVAEIPPAVAEQYRQQFLSNFRSSLFAPKISWWQKPVYQWAVAASFLLLGTVGWWWVHHAHRASTRVADQFVVIENGSGIIKKILLPDSSTIWLNACASLRYKEDFNRKERKVILTGEGFFDIHSDQENPFIIYTTEMAIRVLGTTFNVEAYPNEKLTRVSLLQGKVSVHANAGTKQVAVLQPGFAATCNNSVANMDIIAIDAGKVAAWKTGAFSVTDLSLKVAVERLCMHYGYSVYWKDTTGISKKISVTFTKEAFKKMLDNICYISRKQYKINNRQVIIY